MCSSLHPSVRRWSSVFSRTRQSSASPRRGGHRSPARYHQWASWHRERESSRPSGSWSSRPADGKAGRVLDTQIEAHVHGPVDLRRDVELLVADPAFAATPTGRILRELAESYAIPLRWHCGFQLPVRQVPDDFRGPTMPRLARRIAGDDGTVDAAAIGVAAASLHEHPEAWCDWGSYGEALQHLKQLWHVVVHYGAPARA